MPDRKVKGGKGGKDSRGKGVDKDSKGTKGDKGKSKRKPKGGGNGSGHESDGGKKGDKRNGKRQYTDYFNLTDNFEFLRRVPMISAEDFLRLEGGDDGFIPLNKYNETKKQH